MILSYYGYGYGYGYGRGLGGLYFDWTYLLVLAGVVLTMAASAYVRSTFNRFSKVMSSRGITGAQVAQMMLRNEGIGDVSVRAIGGSLTDNYNPSNKTVNLSQPVYSGTSVAAIGVAAHECGHAIQHHRAYIPLVLRTAIFPLARIGSMLSWPMIIIGLFLGFGISSSALPNLLVHIGIFAFALAVLFQVVTLPVEFNASMRAMKVLRTSGIMSEQEADGSAKVLRAAALTYVAGAASSIMQLMRLLILFGGRRRD